jgi:hypothetical protein
MKRRQAAPAGAVPSWLPPQCRQQSSSAAGIDGMIYSIGCIEALVHSRGCSLTARVRQTCAFAPKVQLEGAVEE